MTAKTKPSGWQYHAGWLCFILCLIMPLLSLLVPILGLSKTSSALLIGGLVVGAPELFMVLAIALWGKSTFDYFITQVFGLFRFLAPAKSVSSTRYYVGLTLLIISFFPSWILSYAPSLVNDTTRICIVLSFDILFVISFFILGGNFWNKVRELFIP